MSEYPASPAPGTVIPEADWHLMFDAVKSRLSTVVCSPASAAVAVAECVAALDWLQKQLPRSE